MTSKVGANLAVVLCVVFFAPLLMVLYGDLQFLAPWAVKWMDKFEVSVGGLMLLSLLVVLYYGLRGRQSSMPKFSFRVASPLRRFGRGFLVGLGRFAVITAITVALSYIGLLPLACRLIRLVFTIVVMAIMFIVWIIQSIIGWFA